MNRKPLNDWDFNEVQPILYECPKCHEKVPEHLHNNVFKYCTKCVKNLLTEMRADVAQHIGWNCDGCNKLITSTHATYLKVNTPAGSKYHCPACAPHVKHNTK